jgi:hypothetical protein
MTDATQAVFMIETLKLLRGELAHHDSLPSNARHGRFLLRRVGYPLAAESRQLQRAARCIQASRRTMNA